MEDEEDLQLKAEEEDRLTYGAMLKVEEHERAQLKVEEEYRISLETIHIAEEQQQ